MKIAHVMMGLERGGARTFMFDLAVESVRQGHAVDIVGFHEGIVSLQARQLNLPFHLVERGARTNLFGPLFRTRCLFVRLRPDVVHTHTYFPHIVARTAARLAHVPVVVSSIQTNLARGHGLSGGGSRLRSKLVPPLVAFTDRFADRLFVVSRDIQKEYLRRGVPAHKISYVPNGIRVEKFAAEVDLQSVKGELAIHPDARVVGTMCSLIPRKRVDLVIRLAKELECKVPRIAVLIIGDGPERGNLERFAGELGVADRVFFIGARYDVHRILPALDVFVLASTMEGTSLALMEAMASGTPCVATAVGGTPEIITDGESGLLVPPGDMPSLSSTVLRLLEDDGLRETLGQKGRQRVRQDYNVMNSIESILKSCSQLLEEQCGKENHV